MSRARPTRRTSRRNAVIGTIGLLVLLAAVVISYRANSGLPLEQRSELYAEVPNANRAVVHDPVRIGGLRVGQVTDVDAVPPSGSAVPYARLKLALEPSAGPIPADTRVQVRIASPLGAGYVELRLGRSSETIPSGGTLPLSQADSTVQLTDLLDVFDDATARGTQTVLSEVGYGLAGRGEDFSDAIGSLSELLGPLTAVERVLASRDANLAGFLRGYEETVAALAPVAASLGSAVDGAAVTMSALAAAGSSLGETIAALPGAERSTTLAFRHLQPGVAGLARLAPQLREGTQVAVTALPAVADTLEAGISPLKQVPPFAVELGGALKTLGLLARDPGAAGGVRILTMTVRELLVLLEDLVPAQLQCNIISIFGTEAGSVLGELGTEATPLEQIGVVTLGADNEMFQNAEPSSNLHTNADPNENYRECESGNEPYESNGRSLGNPPGLQSNTTKETSPPPGVRELAEDAGLLGAEG